MAVAVTERPLASRVREWCSLSWARHCGKVIPVSARKSRLRVRSPTPTARPSSASRRSAHCGGMPKDDPGPWRRMRLWTAAHAIDDMYQGLVPASVPYFVLDRRDSYVAASGLALAATLGSSLPQPVIGLLVDKWRLGWMAAAGVSLAGAGAG